MANAVVRWVDAEHMSYEEAVQELDLSSNGMRLLPPQISNLTRIRRLILDDNALQKIPGGVGSFEHIEVRWTTVRAVEGSARGAVPAAQCFRAPRA